MSYINLIHSDLYLSLMLSVVLASLAVGATAAASGTTVLCRRHPHPEAPPPVVYSLVRTGNTITVLNHNTKICEFSRSSASRIVSNLYRLFGTVAMANSSREVALFYRNSVGNGGYIEFFSQEDHEHSSILLGFLARFQPKKDEAAVAPLRIYVSSKLTGGKYELVLDDSPVRYIWDPTSGELWRVVGTTRKFAARLVSDAAGASRLFVHRDIINPYLAICNCLFFALQASR